MEVLSTKARGVGGAYWKTVQKVKDQKFSVAHIELGFSGGSVVKNPPAKQEIWA